MSVLLTVMQQYVKLGKVNRDYNCKTKLSGDLFILLDIKTTAHTINIFRKWWNTYFLLDEPVVLVPFSQKCQLLVIPSLLLCFGAVDYLIHCLLAHVLLLARRLNPTEMMLPLLWLTQFSKITLTCWGLQIWICYILYGIFLFNFEIPQNIQLHLDWNSKTYSWLFTC